MERPHIPHCFKSSKTLRLYFLRFLKRASVLVSQTSTDISRLKDSSNHFNV